MRIWSIKPNNPIDWNHQSIKITDGKRSTADFIKECVGSDLVSSHHVTNSEESMKVIVNEIGLDDSKLGNTMTVFEDKGKLIQFCYQKDYIEWYHHIAKDTVIYNYFASIINTDIEHIFGTAVFFQINKETNMLEDLQPNILFDLLANLYYVKTYQVRLGDMVEVAFPNVKLSIQSLFSDMRKHKLGEWEFYLPKSSKADMTDLGVDLVDIKDYEGLIFMKLKPKHDNEIQLVDNQKIDDNNSPNIQGLYDDLHPSYLRNFFKST